MSTQNLKNHAQFVPGYHFITSIIIIITLIGAIVNLVKSSESNFYSASLLVMISIISLLVFYYLRAFALKAQDRAIRAEEHFRYFSLTGNRISSKITMSQIIALRFASDDEFVALTDKAAKENLSSKDIKSAIKNWRADLARA